MSSTLSTKWSPPRIVGDLPAGYGGKVFYRTVNKLSLPGKRGLVEFVKIEKKKTGGTDAAARLSSFGTLADAKRNYPDMFDASGALKEEWRQPLRASRKARFPADWDHYDSGFLQLVSPQVKDAIEAVEPGVHLFVPLDITGEAPEDTLRLYISKLGHGGMGFVALSPQSNPKQDYFGDIPGKVTESFLYLDRRKIAGMHWFWCEVGPVYSAELVEKLGDILPESVFYVPVGVTE